ncbi:hypothetical protein [Rathayibacter soli]|uniref:hypothetical protein n=1 Tax=Rathayibacter soli TaxID=3144168 RepID=UPI0027E4CDDF|nr:hypothetical protein [Glaciibacter superstes]
MQTERPGSLDAAGLEVRSRSVTDRRSQELRVTDAGTSLLVQLRSAAEAQDADIAEGLDVSERARQ